MTCLRSRLLGAVLGGVMQQPGSLLSNLTSRFSPALQPTHSRELLFILQEIQAVSILKLVKQSTIGRIQTILQEIQAVSILKLVKQSTIGRIQTILQEIQNVSIRKFH